MAVTCSRCGAQNPDGNQYCQACGTPLDAVPVAVAAVPGPPTTGVIPGPPPGSILGPPPSVPSPGYQSPFTGPGGQPPIHRTSWVLIMTAVFALIVIMAGLGTGIAVLGARASSQSRPPTSIQQKLPSPTPAGSPSPAPSSAPSPTPGGASTVSNAGLSITVPAGWTVVSKDDETITLTDPGGAGSMTVGSGPSSPPQTAQQNKDTLTKFFTGKYPDTRNCPNSQTTTGDLNGATGIFWELCFTLTSGSQSVQAGAPLFAGANFDGSVYYAAILLTTADNMNSFVTEARPVLQSIVWKLK